MKVELLLLFIIALLQFDRALATYETPTVWLDVDRKTVILYEVPITVRFSGFHTRGSCQVDLLDYETNIVIQSKLGSCALGYIKFKFVYPTDRDEFVPRYFYIKAIQKDSARSSNGLTFNEKTAFDFTVYTLEDLRFSKRYLVNYDYIKPMNEWSDYSYDDCLPQDASVWLLSDSNIIGANEHIVVMYEGLDQFEDVIVVLYAENGDKCGTAGKGWEGYVHFRKSGTPDAQAAYLKVWIMNPDYGIPLCKPLKSIDRYQLIADYMYYENRRRLVQTVEARKREPGPEPTYIEPATDEDSVVEFYVTSVKLHQASQKAEVQRKYREHHQSTEMFY